MTRTLTRATATPAEKVTLPLYPTFCGGYGIALLLTPPSVLSQTPVFRTASEVMPLQAWGALFVGFSIAMLTGLGSHRVTLYRVALVSFALSMLVWAGVFTAAWLHGDAAPTTLMWPLSFAGFAWASERMLATREA